MNNKLHQGIAQINNCINIQKNCIEDKNRRIPYMVGMLNGLLVGRSIFIDERPEFYGCRGDVKCNKIRHKCMKR
jgi:hypothetical protein